MTSDERTLTDSRAMRALAHPVRMALLELLAHTGTLTATQASELLAESPANCAFHLRTLAKYGFIEEAGGGRGRERPWRAVNAGINIPEDQEDPEAARAAGVLTDFLTALVLERARSSLAARNSWPTEWRDALIQSESLAYLTVAEARELSAELQQLLERYFDRLGHPERRPRGAMPVEILAVGYPLLHLAAIDTRRNPGEPDSAPAPATPEE
jgi:DNA-binding transcriptional ArsR family regulator